MQLVLGSDEIRALDARAEALGVPSLLLMESAGRGAAMAIRRIVPRPLRRRIVAVCGPGGNGGDALCALRWLGLFGGEPLAIVLGEPKGAAATQAQAFSASFPGRFVQVKSQRELANLTGEIQRADLVLDGILGVGTKGPAHGLAKAGIELIDHAGGYVAAIDLPSGLSADSGAIPGPAVWADLTLAMGALKPCHLLPPAAERCGMVRLIKVAYPPGAWEEVEPLAQVLSAEFCAAALPVRPRFGHKGTFGRVLVVGGAVGMAGAVALAAEGALRAGAGLVHVLCPAPLYPVVEGGVTEAIVHPAPEQEGMFTPEAVDLALKYAEEMDVVLLGPGMGRGPGPQAVVRALLQSRLPKMVVDADALFALAQEPSAIPTDHGELILTPHPGEFARLVGKETAEVVANKITLAREYAKEWRAIIVLKGPPTAIATPEGTVFLNTTGNTALAHGGSGDVLSGLIAGLWASGAEALEAACVGVYAHGWTADRLVKRAAARAILPRDILAALPQTLAELEHG